MTNNTVGFNHMVASGPDAAAYNPDNHSTVALALETMYGYTAYFADNDPRSVSVSHGQTYFLLYLVGEIPPNMKVKCLVT